MSRSGKGEEEQIDMKGQSDMQTVKKGTKKEVFKSISHCSSCPFKAHPMSFDTLPSTPRAIIQLDVDYCELFQYPFIASWALKFAQSTHKQKKFVTRR